MDWQQPAALGLVAVTAGLMVRAALRRRRGRTGCGCGCPAAGGTRPSERVIYHARKGQRPEWVVRPGASEEG